MRSHHASSGILRWLVACGGLIGLLLAIDGFVAFLFLLLAAVVSSGPPNPYSGVIAFVLLPIVMAIGLGVAWGAYAFWTATSAQGMERAGVGSR
jgi:hypothetical protein